jgi:hypothetical protein
VHFELDGRIVELPDASHQIEVLPGRHRLRFSLPPYPDVDREVTVKKGEKSHFVSVRFVRPQPALQMRSEPTPAIAEPTRPIPVATYVLAGSALAAFSMSAALLVSALSAKNDADICMPLCDSETRERIDLRLLFADVSGGVGLVLAGAAAYTFVNRPVIQDRGATPPAAMRAPGTIISFRGHF